MQQVSVERLLCTLCYVLGMWEARQSPWSQEEHGLMEEEVVIGTQRTVAQPRLEARKASWE